MGEDVSEGSSWLFLCNWEIIDNYVGKLDSAHDVRP